MESKEMKNIKKPVYSTKLGSGTFAGADWQCQYCGRIVKGYTYQPHFRLFGKCPESTSGNHAWFEM